MSPLIGISSMKKNTWDREAKSVSELLPMRNITPDLCNGISAIAYNKIHSDNYWAKLMRKIDDDHFELMLLEYSDEDVIEETRKQLVLRQCNILYRDIPSAFLRKIEDGSMDLLMYSFSQMKPTLPTITFSPAIRDYKEPAFLFLKETDILRDDIKKHLLLMILVNGYFAIRLIDSHVSNEHIMLWFGLLMSNMPDDCQNEDVRKYVSMIRQKHLYDMTDSEVGILTNCLISAKSHLCNENITRICHDSYLYARKLVLFDDFDQSELKSVIFKVLIKEGIVIRRKDFKIFRESQL